MKPWQAIALVVGAVALLSGPVRGQVDTPERVQDAQGCPRSGEFPRPEAIEATRTAILCLHNLERGRQGLPPLARNRGLELAAQRHSEDMAARKYFAHETPDGVDPQGRIAAIGYTNRLTGENLYFGSGFEATPVRALRGWMESRGHRANVLRPEFSELGIGVAYDSPEPRGDDRSAVYTANFGG